MRARLMAAAAVLVFVAGCTTPPSPAELAGNAAQKYMNALAAGYYRSACSLLDPHTLASLGDLARCRTLLSRCLPYNAQVAKRDQSQLLYANVDVRVNHSHANALVSGTAVARAVKEVSLAKQGRQWVLTSYGQALIPCVTHAKAKSVHS